MSEKFDAATIAANAEAARQKEDKQKKKEIAKIMDIIEKSMTKKSKKGYTEFIFRDKDEIFEDCNFAEHHQDVAKILQDKKGFVIKGAGQTSRNNPNYGFKVVLPK